MQECGIAAFRHGVTIIPLSLDGSVPPAFIGHIQSTRVEAGSIALRDLLPGLAKLDVAFVIDLIVEKISRSGSFRGAEANFALIVPFVGKASDDQMLKLLRVSLDNGQVLHASQVARQFMPPILRSHGHLLGEDERAKLEGVLAEYA
jgi:hypothetical protein